MITNVRAQSFGQRAAVILLFAGVALWQGWSAYQRGDVLSGDQMLIVAGALKDADPSLYRIDPIFGANQYQFNTPTFRAILVFLMRLGLEVRAVHAVLLAISSFVYLCGMGWLIFEVTKNRLTSAMVAYASLFPYASAGSTYWGIAGLGAVVPRSVFLGFIPITMAAYWRWRQTVWVYAVFFGLGVVSNLHPVSGFYLSQALLLTLVVEFGVSPATIKRALLAAGCFAVGIAPFAVGFAKGGSSAPSALREELIEAIFFRYQWALRNDLLIGAMVTMVSVGVALAIALILQRRATGPQARSSWAVWGSIIVGGITFWTLFPTLMWLPLFMLASAGLVVRRRQGWIEQDRFFLRLGLAIIITTLIWPIAQTGFVWLFDQPPRLVELYRGLRTLYVILFVYSAVYLAHQWQALSEPVGRSRFRSGAAVLVAMIYLFFPLIWSWIPYTPAGRTSSETRQADFMQACEWVRAHTPQEALFLFYNGPDWSSEEPVSAAGFRLYAQRSIVVSYKDGGYAFYYGPEAMIAWYRRFRDVERVLQSEDLTAITHTAQRYHASFLVLDQSRAKLLQSPVFHNAGFVVYSLQ